MYDPVNVTTAFLADQAVAGVDAPLVAAAARLADRVRDHSLKRSAAASEAAERIAQRWAVAIGIALALGIGLALWATVWMTRSVLGSLGGEPAAAVAVARRIADGDLSVAVPLRAGDETSLMASLERMQESLRNTIVHVSGSGELIASASTELSATALRISQATGQQSDASSSMAAAVEQMTTSIEQVAAHSGSALCLSNQSGSMCEEGSQTVAAVAAEMNAIADSAHRMADIMRELDGRSTSISKIVHVISEIAGQTNLLALNAAIEAARAGEQGRGFAVVADEVRKLAERTSSSTGEIGAMVQAIQSGTAQAVQHMEGWSGRVTEGVARARGAGERMVEVRASTGQVAAAVSGINAALNEQSSTSTLLAQNVERVSSMSEENARAVEAMSDQAGQLDPLARSLQGIIGRFRLVPQAVRR